jgi:hypothetical protein
MTAFPPLVPSSRTFTPGEYPATAFSGFSGAQNRVRHSNVFLAAQLRLTFLGLTQSEMLNIWNHYNNRRGEFRSFELPAEVVSYGSITDYVPGNYIWRYAGPGVVEDLPCGNHNVSLTLETVPPTAASVVGAQLFTQLRLAAGDAAGGEYAEGIDETITMSVTSGDAFVAINGISETIGIGLDTGGAAGDVSAFGVTEGMVLFLETGSAADVSVLGISKSIMIYLNPWSFEPAIGEEYEGGYFAGYISHTADGVATHRLIVAPRATGATGTGYTLTTNLQWKTSNTATAGATNLFDGAVNTAAMVAAGINDHPAAKFCVELSINGFDDWYLPTRVEYAIAYINLKPTTTDNNTSQGINNYSVPKRTTNYTLTDPTRTSVLNFRSGGSEAFVGVSPNGDHVQSLESSAAGTQRFNFDNGSFAGNNKTDAYCVRAFRKVAI